MPASPKTTELSEQMLQALEWLVVLRSGEISEAQTHEFADWLSQDRLHAQAFAKAEDLLNDAAIAAQSPRFFPSSMAGALETNPTIAPVSKSKPTKARQRYLANSFTRWRAATLSLAAAWLFAVGLILPEQAHLFDDYFYDYHTGTGELQDIQLVDGSHLVLNTNTAVSVDYSEAVRQITLHHGQALFTVAKDSNRPFLVTSGELTVRALGTIFEVSNLESGETSVTVQEHAVAVNMQNDTQQEMTQQNPVEVKEGQRLRYDSTGHTTRTETVNLAQALAWQERRLVMIDRPISELISELNRYHTGRIFIRDADLKELRITGVFSLANPNETLSKVSTVLGLQETRLGAWWVMLHR